MSSPAPSVLDNLTLNITQEIRVRASLDATFAALLEQLGPYNEVGDDKPMPMVLEAWPGGRWFSRPSAMATAITGAPCRPSRSRRYSKSAARSLCRTQSPTISNTRLSEEQGGTLIKFHHSGFGLLVEGRPQT